jgi:hypothetical protein
MRADALKLEGSQIRTTETGTVFTRNRSVIMHTGGRLKAKDLRMMAARLHRQADASVPSVDREKMHGAALALDAEADVLAENAIREALFGGIT